MDNMLVSVAYAIDQQQEELPVEVSRRANVAMALHASGILDRFQQWCLPDLVVGIFGKKVSLDTLLVDGDRVEIYQPLQVDPKQARRLRASKKNR